MENSKEIMVTIKCLAYNHEKYIERMLESCIAQKTNFKFEILVHDDASTDKTALIIKKYEKKYPDIVKPIYETENQYRKSGAIDKIMVPKMRGKYIAFCEGDDYWIDENKLQMQVDYLEKHPECSYTFHDAIIVWENGKKRRNFFPEEILKSPVWSRRNKIYKTEDIIELGFIPTASIVARKELIVNKRQFCEKMICGDLPLRLSLALDGYAYYFNKKMSAYRTGNINSAAGKARGDFQIAKRTYDGQCEILNGFNEMTNYKYDASIQHDIQKRKLRLLISNLNIEKIKQDNLWMMYKKEVKLSTKIKNFVKIYFGNTYEIIRNIRNKIKKIN